jgi:hypothetical protein
LSADSPALAEATIVSGGRRWVKVKNRGYWRWELEREGAFTSRRQRQFV